ncbi:hypothetical protein AC623_11175 [Bacillus sp. FJAT-27231]|uniref:hypothetical protein n=1 Tax=Bacillus sp. FJAT-27231 TaxID=1679168 RepID=UPI000670CC04|nr:hypothetical protein [Bacillus sp. FJAT-27231]KMY54423.1 hypothetical protein AC623_11175 [Bacillus sp. FJAT-27231]
MILKGIKNFEDLDDFIFENKVDIRCKESSLSVTLIEPTEEEEGIIALILSDGSQLELPVDQLDDYLEVVPMEK